MQRPTIYEGAAIQGRGLVQVLVTSTNPFSWTVVLGDHVLTEVELEDFSLVIDVGEGRGPTISAMLSYQGKDLEGKAVMQTRELFPCTVMLSACHKLFWITSQ